jgi:DNA-directed RNA polymerase specialized sigma24 family protein
VTRPIWDLDFENRVTGIVARVCERALADLERERAWRQLLVLIAPHVERWANQSRILRRVGLTSEDEPREILALVLGRLAERGFANLANFLSRTPTLAALDPELELIEGLARLGRLREDEREGSTRRVDDDADDDATRTPFRAWLLTLVDYAVKDHVRHRLGWSVRPGEESTKRDINTNAERLDNAPEEGARPPITDYLAMSRLVGEAHAFMDTFPAPMRDALRLWLDDEGYGAIADLLALSSADAAKALVRAGQARLRERFRGSWPEP